MECLGYRLWVRGYRLEVIVEDYSKDFNFDLHHRLFFSRLGKE